MEPSHSVEFFDAQFRRQIERHEFALNPFESAALPFVRGRVLDFGCGLGNLVLHAARRGHAVLALDASEAAVARLQRLAHDERLPLVAAVADLRTHCVDLEFDTVVCIGLLMFFDCATARRQLEHLKTRVRPGGILVLNVLIEGTTFLDMFGPEGHCLFGRNELFEALRGWTVQLDEDSTYDAPGGRVKRFATVIAQCPRSDASHVPGAWAAQ